MEDRILYDGAPLVDDAMLSAANDGEGVTVMTALEDDSPQDPEDSFAAENGTLSDGEGEDSSASSEEEDSALGEGIESASGEQEIGRNELLVLDGRIEDWETLASELEENSSDGIILHRLMIGGEEDGLASISDYFADLAQEGIYFDAVHIVSHASEGRLSLGGYDYRADDLVEGLPAMEEISQWQEYLLDGADILLYGCDLGAGESGAQLLQQISRYSGADVAASLDVTGAPSSGGNWDLEVSTGSVETTTLISTLDFLLPAGAQPEVSITAPSTVPIGESVDITIHFENSSSDETTGYGPWIDVAIDRTGADGEFDPLNPETGSGSGLYDGFQLTEDPTYLGVPLSFYEITLDDSANGGLGVLHPYALDAAGDPIYLNTGSIAGDPSHPYHDLLDGFESGDLLLVVELPFGSFTPDQPLLDVELSLELSGYADLDQPLNIHAQGGFRYGEDPLNNPTADPVIIGGSVGTASTPVDASLAELTKEYNGPEGETATGPNFERSYTILVDIAEGQTLSDLNIFDDLPDEIQFLSLGSVIVGGTTYTQGAGPGQYSLVHSPDTNFTGGSLQLQLNGPITGIDGTDVEIEVNFYVPREYDPRDSSGNLTGDPREEVLPSSSGDFKVVENQAYGYGTWTPQDPRDDVVTIGLNVDGSFDGTDPSTAAATAAPDSTVETTITAQSLAIQKGVEIVVDDQAAGVTPGDILEYTVDFQISDYFAFDQMLISDELSDGQLFLDLDNQATYRPVLSLSGNGFDLVLDFDPTYYTVDYFASGTGITSVTFDVSGQLIAYANSLTALEVSALDPDVYQQMLAGQLLGGGVDPNDPSAVIDNDLGGLTPFDDGGTIGRILFQAEVLDMFVEEYPSGEPSLNPRDELTNSIAFEGRVLDLDNALVGTANTQVDGSGTSIFLEANEVVKEIYAVNGIVRLTDPTDPNSAENPAFTAAFRDPSGAVNLQPDDEITYRISYEVLTGDVEELRLSDYFPLPIFDVSDPDSDGTPSSFTFVNNLSDVSISDLGSGVVTYGPSHTLHDVSIPGASVPTLVVDPVSNSLTLLWGDFVSAANESEMLDVLITMTVSEDPYADEMYLTNQVQLGEQNTQNPGVENEATTNAIIEVVINQPVVDIYKGVVASTQGGGVGAVGSVEFTGIGVGADGFTGTLSGEGDAAAIGALDLDSGTLPDSGDTVRYAIVLQNTGRSDAFGVSFSDTLLDSYENDFGNVGDFLSGTNFRIMRGDGTLLAQGVDYTLAWSNTTKEFSVELTDNYSAGNIGSESKTGALSRGHDISTDSSVSNGSNSIVVLYDLEVAETAEASSTLTNTATLSSYSNGDNAESHVPVGEEPSDPADVLVATPAVSKVLLGTGVDATGNNAADQAVVGEEVYYRITMTIPEGVTSGVVLTDTMPAGLAFVGINSVSYSPGVSSSNTPGLGTTAAALGSNVSVGAGGNSFEINFGDITNSDTDNGTLETITIDFTAVVLNVSGNQSGTELGNDVAMEYTWTDDPSGGPDSNTLSANADEVTVVEPSITVSSELSHDNSTYEDSLEVDAGDTVYYRIVLENDSDVDAHNVSIYDRLPTIFELGGGTTTIFSVSGGGFDGGDFELVLDDKWGEDKWALRSTADGTLMTLDAGDSVTIVVRSTIVDNVTSAATYPNAVEVRWTSMDDGVTSAYNGSDATGMPVGGMPGSDTPVIRSEFSSDAVERTGEDGDGGALNDYAAENDTELSTHVVNSFVKTLVDTSLTQPGNNASDEAVIGEIVTYEIRFRIPEGETHDFVLTDVFDPGLGFVAFTGLSISSGLSSSTGLNPSSTASDLNALMGSAITYTHTADNDENTLTIDFGDIVNSNINDDGATNPSPGDEIVITYEAVVLNVSGNQQDAQLENEATATYNTVTGSDENSDSSTGPATALSDSADQVTVVEPTVTVSKEATSEDEGSHGDPLASDWGEEVDDLDANDLFFFRIQLQAGTTTAYDLSLLDELPDGLANAAIHSVGSTGNVAFEGTVRSALVSDFEINGSYELVNTVNIDMEAGATLTIILSGTVSEDAGPGLSIDNSANVQWTSLDGDVTDISGNVAGDSDSERTGDGTGNNDYNDTDDASALIRELAVEKQLVSTSESHTDGSDVVIGEIARYRLIVTIPEGTLENFQIRDFLPDGLSFLDDNSATLAFVSEGGITSSIVGLSGANLSGSSGNISPTFAIPGSQISVSGNEVLFELGTLVNTAENDSNSEFVVIEFNALVSNDLGNQEGADLDNTFEAIVGTNPSVVSNEVTISVVEPSLTIAKSVVTEPEDAGDDFVYEIAISNSSGVDAFNVTLEDVLSPYFNFYDRNSNSTIGLDDALEIVSGPAGVALGNFEVTDFAEGGPSNILQTTGNGFTLEDGESLTLRIYGRLSQSVNPAEVIENVAVTTWSSLPDSGTSSSDPGNPTGSQTLGGDGDPDGERNGSDGEGPGALNDYSASSVVATATVNEIAIDKYYFESSESYTADIDQDVAIGETVTYAILVTLPESTLDGLLVTDVLPAGMSYITGSAALVTTVGSSVDWDGNPLLSNDFEGTFTDLGGGSYFNVSGGAGSSIEFSFAEIEVDASTGSVSNQFLITFDALVSNVSGNQDGSGLVNSAEAQQLDDFGDPTGDTASSGDVTVTVVEPELEVLKEVSSAAG
ncbi:MAG: isopeptide-forming domain-containing fimbrial protein, partial [Puniceicoccales bacterium]